MFSEWPAFAFNSSTNKRLDPHVLPICLGQWSFLKYIWHAYVVHIWYTCIYLGDMILKLDNLRAGFKVRRLHKGKAETFRCWYACGGNCYYVYQSNFVRSVSGSFIYLLYGVLGGWWAALNVKSGLEHSYFSHHLLWCCWVSNLRITHSHFVNGTDSQTINIGA